ncbi:hypothetical protein [Amycolatopsis sp. NPDC059657]|uniref:hypothetical protein n=1 Tax=Amycolatopsis sp. NPDC059657 TaxID=3346899 RepID=UPI00366D510C
MYATFGKGSGGAAVEEIRLRQVAGPGQKTLRLWENEPESGGYRVDDDTPMRDVGERPSFATVLTFAGPASDAVKQAGDRAHRERVAPAMADFPGTVRVLGLWDPRARQQVMIVLATSIESLEEGGKRISELPLLPGEDPELLPGPDHVELYRVES